MSPESRLRRGRGFAAFIAGAVVASLLWLTIVSLTVMSPDEAGARRESPDLPPPTATIERSPLRQVAWYPCERHREVVTVDAPVPPAGYRSVVTATARAGSPVRTGTQLASVSGVPLIAIVTSEPFYRPFRVGDRGPDVQGFESGLKRAGLLASADDQLDATTVAVWNSRFNRRGPASQIPLQSLVAVPRNAVVEGVTVTLGDEVAAGTPLVQVGSNSDQFTCQVPDTEAGIGAQEVDFELGGQRIAVASIVAVPRERDSVGRVVVSPVKVADGEARLGIEDGASEGAVLHAPAAVVKSDSRGRQVVVVLDGDRRREVPVAVGITAQGQVELAGEGLTAGTELVLFGTARP